MQRWDWQAGRNARDLGFCQSRGENGRGEKGLTCEGSGACCEEQEREGGEEAGGLHLKVGLLFEMTDGDFDGKKE